MACGSSDPLTAVDGGADGSQQSPGPDASDALLSPPPSYLVGGTVNGLSGTVILKSAEAGDVTLTASGPFTFPKPLAVGTAYVVTVASTPANQRCTAQNASGTISDSNVTNVIVTCVNKSWKHPTSLADGISPNSS